MQHCASVRVSQQANRLTCQLYLCFVPFSVFLLVFFSFFVHSFPSLSTLFLTASSFPIPLSLVSLLSHSLRGFSYQSCALGAKARTHTELQAQEKKKKEKKTEVHGFINIYKRNYNSLPQDVTAADVCLTSVSRRSRGEYWMRGL